MSLTNEQITEILTALTPETAPNMVMPDGSKFQFPYPQATQYNDAAHIFDLAYDRSLNPERRNLRANYSTLILDPTTSEEAAALLAAAVAAGQPVDPNIDRDGWGASATMSQRANDCTQDFSTDPPTTYCVQWVPPVGQSDPVPVTPLAPFDAKNYQLPAPAGSIIVSPIPPPAYKP